MLAEFARSVTRDNCRISNDSVASIRFLGKFNGHNARSFWSFMEPAKKLEELVAWQLASQLSDLIDQMVAHPAASRNGKLCEQIAASSASVAANLAEGFGRFYPRANAGFVRIAKGSLTETQNHLKKGSSRGCWRAADYTQAWRLSCRTMKAIVPYLRYLERCDRRGPW